MRPGPRRERDSGHRTVLALGAQFFVNGCIYATLVGRLSEVRDQPGVSTAALGLALSTGSLVALAASFFTGAAIRRAGSKPILVAGGLFYAAALVGIGASTSGTILVVTLVALAAFDIAHFGGAASIAVIALLIITPDLLPSDQPHPLQRRLVLGSRGKRWALLGAAAISLAVANAMAETFEIATGEWAGLRVRDDLGAGAGMAAATFVVFTVAMAGGRLFGDHATSRFGAAMTARGGLAIAVTGVLLATLPGSVILALAGVAMIGLGISVLAPQLADAAARAPGRPGSGFTALFIGHRAAGLYTPAAIGILASSNVLSVGSAMALIMIPTAIVLVCIIGSVLRLPARL